MSWLVAEEQGKENTILLYTPTYAEHEDADRFRKQVAQYIGLPITVQEDGRSLWQLIDYNKCIPNVHFPFCTRVLKMEQTEEYLKTIKDNFILYYGFGPEEWRRVQKATARNEQIGREVKFPLWEKHIPDATVKETIKNGWHICLPETYKFIEHNNCLPCWKGSKKHFYKVWKYYPEQFWKAVEKEELYGPYTLFDKPLRVLADIWKSNKEFDESQMSILEPEENIPCMCSF